MKIDTTVLAGWEGRTVTLRFMHGIMNKGGDVLPYPQPLKGDGYCVPVTPLDPRATVAVLHEHRENLVGARSGGRRSMEKRRTARLADTLESSRPASLGAPRKIGTARTRAGTTRSSACWRSAPPTIPSPASRRSVSRIKGLPRG